MLVPPAAALSVGLLALATVQQSDSQRILRAARDAQADFEWTRRRNLPRAPGGGGGAACDERIGRFCYWHDDGDADVSPRTPPDEPRPTRDARDRLVRQLDSSAALLPGDEWIAGQRVRYLVESGRTAEALAAARACRAAAWWCEALAGYTLHAAGDFSGADTAYRSALLDMSLEERCRWTDLSLLLEGDLARRYRRLSCEERGAFEDRLWWLAQPLHSLPAGGNDRRTEHLARATLSRIQEKARTAYGVSWGDDLREITLRYGWPTHWTQETRGWSATPEIVITGHEPRPSFHFLPDARAFDGSPMTNAAGAAAWTLQAPRPRERYAPAYAHSVVQLEHQVAFFRRARPRVERDGEEVRAVHGRDSCLVVAAYDVGRDTLFAGAPLDAALVLARDERAAPVIERRAGGGASDILVAKTECGPLLLSLEVVAPLRRHAARARYGVHPSDVGDGGIAVSDVLFFDPPDSLPADLAAVLPYVRAVATARRDARLGLFWEVYGLNPAGEVVTASVNVVPARTGWLRRRTESIGLARRRAPVRLEWTETPRAPGVFAGRALALDLSGLSPGRYRVEVRVETDRGSAGATREVRVVAP